MIIDQRPTLYGRKKRQTSREEYPLFSSHYYRELFHLKCGPDLLRTHLYDNPKEYTESAAAFNAVKEEFFGYLSQDCIVVSFGDGSRPRTAALFAFRTSWISWAVDPILKQED